MVRKHFLREGAIMTTRIDSAPVTIEQLEGRLFLSTTAHNVVYVESNDPRPGKNSILAYRQNPTTGALTPLAGGPFFTGGKGVENLDEGLGPDDSDQEVIVSKDKRFLF